MAKFVCKVCGYVYDGDAAPAECPVCHVDADQFEEVKGEKKLAAEHEYGVYAKTVKNNPDGSVSIVAQGEELPLEHFIKKIKASPSVAGHVDHVDLNTVSDAEKFTRFSVVY